MAVFVTFKEWLLLLARFLLALLHAMELLWQFNLTTLENGKLSTLSVKNGEKAHNMR